VARRRGAGIYSCRRGAHPVIEEKFVVGKNVFEKAKGKKRKKQKGEEAG
jgi:hypothetical protein